MMNNMDELKALSKDDLENWAERQVADSLFDICNFDSVASEIASTNAIGWELNEYNFEDVELTDSELLVNVKYSLRGRQEDDKPWCGTQITGTISASIDACGEVTFTNVTAERDSEKSDYNYGPEQEEIYQAEPPQATVITGINLELKRYFANHPEKIHDISPRKFEELIADILKDLGFETELTKATRDGGCDIYAYMRNAVTSFLMFVECKKWAIDNKVGIEVVQRLHGAAKGSGAHKSMIVTTSLFTSPAREAHAEISHEMELKDYNDLKTWLDRYKQWI
jgi:restriction endonuclease Mrr